MAKIRLDEDNHKMHKNRMTLKTIFGDVSVPLNDVQILPGGIIEVPDWTFYSARLNPCQMVSGFIKEETA